MNSERTIVMFALIVAAVSLAAAFVAADPTAPVSTALQSSSSRDLSGLPAQTVDARGGNVTQINIEALTITKAWQGYYGQVSGEITLDDASSNTFYNWSMTSVGGEVYATRASSITWTNVNCTNATNVTAEQTYLGQVTADGDSVTNTFSLTTHPAFNVSTSQIFADTCRSTHGFANNASQSQNWTQVLLTDWTGGHIIYTTILNDTAVGFDGGTYDFQLLVGENEHTGSIGVTQYYFWVELN